MLNKNGAMMNQRNVGQAPPGMPPPPNSYQQFKQPVNEIIPEVASGNRTKSATPHGSEGGRSRARDKEGGK